MKHFDPRVVLFCLAFFGCSAGAQSRDFLAFGGSDHDIFLGCLTCAGNVQDSICNRYTFGSKFSPNSIFNQFGPFGNKFAASGVWNKFALSDGLPVVVDRKGIFYGYLTINKFAPQASFLTGKLLQMFDTAEGNLDIVQNMICGVS